MSLIASEEKFLEPIQKNLHFVKELFKNSAVSDVGISKHYNLVATALKSQLQKGNAKRKL